MEAYYQQQSISPYFSGHYRQRGSGFVALAAGIGRAALPITRKVLWPETKRIGRELIAQAAPEIVEIVSKKKTPKEAIKSTLKKTVKKQIGGSRKILGNQQKSAERTKRIIRKKQPVKRSRSNFFFKSSQ